MKTIVHTTLRVNRCSAMQHLRLKASLAQRWRRRLAASSPAAWVEFKAMYAGEIDASRRDLAKRIRAVRHANHLS